jgi:hypothetical protein
MDRYAAKDMAIAALYGAPVAAFATACRMAHVVKTLVGLPRQVASVNGLKRKLAKPRLALTSPQFDELVESHSAATTKPLHLLPLLGEVNRKDWPASPESAMAIRELALRRSTAIYSRYVKTGQEAKLGRRERTGSSKGAWWYTPPS